VTAASALIALQWLLSWFRYRRLAACTRCQVVRPVRYRDTHDTCAVSRHFLLLRYTAVVSSRRYQRYLRLVSTISIVVSWVSHNTSHDVDHSRSRDCIWPIEWSRDRWSTRPFDCDFLLVVHWYGVPYLWLFPRYLAPTISASRHWLFGITWHHRARDHLIPYIPFPIGVPL